MKKIKKLLLLLGVFILFVCFGYLVYAAIDENNYYYFPEDNSGDINLSITASGPSNAMDYYPWGYGIYVNKWSDGKRRITSIQIKKPALKDDEIYSSNTSCTSEDYTECYGITYQFRWTTPEWYEIESEVKWNKFSSDGFVEMYDDILLNANNVNDQHNKPTEIILKDSKESNFLVKVFLWDDIDSEGTSYYSDISKKFSLRVNKEESSYIWISRSPDESWIWNSLDPYQAWNMNFATVHIKGWYDEEITYQSLVEPERNQVRIVTIDMDNARVDSSSTPPLYNSYIDIYLKRKTQQWDIYIDKNWEETLEPFTRISPRESWYDDWYWYIPAVNTNTTQWIEWPSGSFRCSNGTIWTPWFIDCYNNQTFKWISEHTINFPSSEEYQILEFVLHNWWHWSSWNAFALAGDIDMFSEEIPIDSLLEEVENDITWTLSVEIKATWDNSTNADFLDDLEETGINQIHTYKTEICNNSNESITNTLVMLWSPDKTTLIDDTLTLNWNVIENTWTSLNQSVFDSEINLGTLAVWECSHITYQVSINSDVSLWDDITLSNSYTYDGKTIAKSTNTTVNPVSTQAYEALLTLIPNPDSWSSIKPWDYISYQAIVKNTGLMEIESGTISCPRLYDDNQTQCRVWGCSTDFSFTDLYPWVEVALNYSVMTSSDLESNDIIEEQCKLSYDTISETIESYSNEVYHTIQSTEQEVDGWNFILIINSAYRLLNSPDGDPRPDEYDRDYITYEYYYSGTDRDYIYPDLSDEWTYTDSRWSCSSITWSNVPNSITYNINSTSTSSQNNLSLSSNDLTFNINTSLPDSKPQTILSLGTLYPTHTIPGEELNEWYKNGGSRDLSKESTEHRAIENGSRWKVFSTIKWDVTREKWKYVPYDTSTCSYDCRCSDEEWWCETCYREYTKYRWEVVSTSQVFFENIDDINVTVWWSTAWIKSSNWSIHTNNWVRLEWNNSNTYDLSDSRTAVVSVPKNYTPPWESNADYVISSAAWSSNLISRNDWYVNDKYVEMSHWEVYSRDQNARDFYDDLLDKELYWEVIEKTDTRITWLDLELNKVYHYTWWDVYFDNWNNYFIVWWNKATIVIEWDLHVKSNMFYDQTQTVKKREYLPVLGLIVKWDVYVYPEVEYTIWSWYIDQTLYTWESVQTLKHLWSWVADNIVFERKAPEYYERDVNEPSEWVSFDNDFYWATPPWFAKLNDWMWSYSDNINVYSGREVDY